MHPFENEIRNIEDKESRIKNGNENSYKIEMF